MGQKFMREVPALYALAKQITLDAGFDYTDPRTLKTIKAPRKKKVRKGRQK